MYAIGDTIVYGTTGVCVVADITDPPVKQMDQTTKYYLLRPKYQGGTIYCPLNNPKAGMRAAMSREEALSLIDRIPSLPPEPIPESSLQATQHYQAVFDANDPERLVSLILSLYAKKRYMQEQRRKFGQADERFMKRAENVLHGELAFALGLEPGEVAAFIARRTEEHSL